jgi:hypothetical protein
LYEDLRSRLDAFTRAFNDRISDACYALTPSPGQIEAMGRERAYSTLYARWKASHGPLFQRIALAVPESRDGGLSLLNLNLDTAQFSPSGWPAEWSEMRDQLVRRLVPGGRGPAPFVKTALFEMPSFDGGREQEWLLVELNREYISGTVLPELVNRYLGQGGTLDYDVKVVEASNPAAVIYESPAKHADILSTNADAAAPMLSIRPGPSFDRRPQDRGPRGPGRRGGPPPGPFRAPSPAPGVRQPGFGPGRWMVLVRHQAGSLEAMVAQTQRRNLAISAGVLALILATVAMLVRFSRQAQRLADLQMGFVAGVSHELRTP